MSGVLEMQPQFSIQILSKKLIKPATPTPNNFRKFKISCIDQHRPPAYAHHIFFYPANDRDEREKFAERSKQLQVSLSEILTLYYPLAGRYIEDKVLIDCNDDGAEYVEAKVASHLAPVLPNRDFDSELLNHLFPHHYESSTSPLIAIQFNMFECGGQAIGLCSSHRIVDAFVLTKFVYGWTTACRVGIDKVHRMSFDLAGILPPREVVPAAAKPVTRSNPDLKFASKKFVFSGPAISSLRQIAQGGGDKDLGRLACEKRPSRVQLVTALIWKALIGVEQAKHGQLRPSVIAHWINMRGRTGLPISDDCFGNFVRLVMVSFKPDKSSNKVEFRELVSLVCDAMTNAFTDCAKAQNGDDLFTMVIDARKEVSREFNRDADEVKSYMFSSTCGMPFYPDFGWGKPTRVTRIEGRSEVIIGMMDTRDGDGIEAWIHLAENDLSLFQQDPDMVAFTSQLEQHDDHLISLRSRY